MLGMFLPGALRRLNWRLALVGAWAIFLLLPVWRTGWVSDDEVNSLERGFLIHEGLSPIEHSYLEFRGWMSTVGRINPLIYFLKDCTFWLLPNLMWYKTYLVVMILVNLVLFYRLLKRLGAGPDLAGLCCLLAATLIQLRAYPDPVLSFNGLMQWLFLTTILSLGLYHRYLTGGGRFCLAGSILLYLAAALTYEMTYPFWILHCGMFFTTRRIAGRVWTLAPFAAIPVLLTLASLWMRSLPECKPGGYAMGLNAGAVASTCLKQFVAALPCSYGALAQPELLLPGIFSWKTLGTHPATLFFGFLAAVPFLWGVTRREGRADRPAPGALPILGLLLAILPVLMLSLAQRYQDELCYGLGHLPVYIQYFGVALLLGCGASFLVRRVRHGGLAAGMLVVLGSGLCAVTAVFHAEANDRVVALYRIPFLSPRREIEEILDDGGLLAEAPAGAVLVADPNSWDPWGGETAFYCSHTRTKWKEVWTTGGANRDQLSLFADRPVDEAEGPVVLRVRYFKPEIFGGYALAGKLHSIRATSGFLYETGINQIRLGVRRPWGSRPDQAFVFHASLPGVARGDDGAACELTIRPNEMQRIGETRNWTIYGVDLPCPIVNGESVWVETVRP